MTVDVTALVTNNLDLWSSTIKAKSATGRGSKSKRELYGIKKLRELILELAVRGLLVPQDPNDEPASILLKKIAVEKSRLEKEKKIKKQKPLPSIEEEEKQFNLPNGWSWTKLGNLVEMYNGRAFKSQEWRASGVPIVRIQNLNNIDAEFNYFDGELADHNRIDNNSFLISWSGTPGTSFGAFVWLRGEAALNQHINNCIFHHKDMNLNFMKLAVNGCMNHFISMAQGAVGLKHVTKGTLNNAVLAFPPEAEQHRIVSKVNELMVLCDQLEQQQESSITAHETLVKTVLEAVTRPTAISGGSEGNATAILFEHFDTLFTTEHSINQLKQTILQLAVMGKLVPQNPNDEPASELLKKIAKEKARLVKEKKIKKQKPLPPIGEDEKPFELPVGWEWTRFEDVVEIYSGITKGRKLAGRALISVPYLSVANVQRSHLNLTNVKEIEIPIEEKEKYQVMAGDLLITEGGDWDKVGRTTIWRDEMNYVAHQNHVFKARPFLSEQSEYWLEMYLNCPFSRDYFAGSSKQTTNLASINKTQLRSCLIAVPPASEKEKIVSKLNQFTTLCDNMLDRIKAAQTAQLNLTDAIAEQATS